MPSYPDLWTTLGDARPKDAGEVGRWRTSLIPFAVRRSWPLLGAAGVPPPIALEPAGLARIARRLIARFEAVPYSWPAQFDREGHWIDDTRTAGAVTELVRAFVQLSHAYGPAVTRELVDWLLRNEVRWAIRERWWAWSCFFTDVAYGRAEVPSDLGSRGDKVRGVIVSSFGRLLTDRLIELRAMAETIPLSRTERRLIALETDPGDPPASIDVLGDLALAAEREQARLVFQILAAALTEPELNALTESARARTGNTSL